LGTKQRFFRLDSHGSIRQPLDYPQRYPATPITANRTADIDAISFQSLQSRSQAHVYPSQEQVAIGFPRQRFLSPLSAR
jgi:hypothetical protein